MTLDTMPYSIKNKRHLTHREDSCTHDQAVDLIDTVKELGSYPKEAKATDDAGNKECQLAHNIRKGRKKGVFTPAQEIELNELQAVQDDKAVALDIVKCSTFVLSFVIVMF